MGHRRGNAKVRGAVSQRCNSGMDLLRRHLGSVCVLSTKGDALKVSVGMSKVAARAAAGSVVAGMSKLAAMTGSCSSGGGGMKLMSCHPVWSGGVASRGGILEGGDTPS